MNKDFYKMLTFIKKLSNQKASEQSLREMSRLDESTGDNAQEIFENGLKNAEATIAVEARLLLSTINLNVPMQIGDVFKPDLPVTYSLAKPSTFTETEKLLSLPEMEKIHINKVLMACNYNKKSAAKILNISLKTLYNKLHSGEESKSSSSYLK